MLLADAVVLPVSLLAAAWLVTPQVVDLLPAWVWVIPVVVGLVGLRFGGAYRSVVRFMGFELVVAAFKTLTVPLIARARGHRVGRQLAGRASCERHVLVARHGLRRRRAPDGPLVPASAQRRRRPGRHLRRRRRRRASRLGAARARRRSCRSRSSTTTPRCVSPSSTVSRCIRRSDLRNLIEEFGVSRVLLALPSVSRRRRLEIINQLEQLPVHVQTMPDTGGSRGRQCARRRHPRGRHHGPARSRRRAAESRSCSTPAFAASRSW